jgi:predicted DNA-binding transcriptional regulator YafY
MYVLFRAYDNAMAKLDSPILSVLPTRQSSATWMSTPEIRAALEQRGISVNHTKTVQRRLALMEKDGLVLCRRVSRELQWQRELGVSGIARKGAGMMTSDEALALKVLQRFASYQIPTLVNKVLAELFVAADKCLEQARFRDPKYTDWTKKVAVTEANFPLLKPRINQAVFEGVSQSLFLEQKLELRYRPGYWGDAKRQPKVKAVCPLGLVESGGLVYMVASMEGKPDPTMYRLDRIVEAKVLLDRFTYPKKFSLEAFIGTQREFDFLPQGEIQLKLRFYDGSGLTLRETPVSKDQTLETCADGTLQLTSTVVMSRKLRWWIRSFGPLVEVLAPAELRAEFANESEVFSQRYRNK